MAQILIVDDSPTIRRMVKASLARLDDCEFIEASSGLDAIERLAVGAIDLMVLDLNMPDMHGLEVLGFVRSHHKYQPLPVIVLTTRDDQESRNAATLAGATSYQTKPFKPEQLFQEAQRLITPRARASQ